MTVFVYHEYRDDFAFGELLTEVFESEDDAWNFLRMRVTHCLGIPFNELGETIDPAVDIFTERELILNLGDVTYYWTITEKSVCMSVPEQNSSENFS